MAVIHWCFNMYVSYHAWALQESADLKARQRMPGIPEGEKKRIAAEIEELEREKERLREWNSAVHAAYKNPAEPPVHTTHTSVCTCMYT